MFIEDLGAQNVRVRVELYIFSLTLVGAALRGRPLGHAKGVATECHPYKPWLSRVGTSSRLGARRRRQADGIIDLYIEEFYLGIERSHFQVQ